MKFNLRQSLRQSFAFIARLVIITNQRRQPRNSKEIWHGFGTTDICSGNRFVLIRYDCWHE